jgi:hypothetical protein
LPFGRFVGLAAWFLFCHRPSGWREGFIGKTILKISDAWFIWYICLQVAAFTIVTFLSVFLPNLVEIVLTWVLKMFKKEILEFYTGVNH